MSLIDNYPNDGKFFSTRLGIGLAAVQLLLALLLPDLAWAQGTSGQDYIIQSSDSLWKLAEKYLGDGNLYSVIITATADKAATDPAFTPINSPDRVYPGQKIWIPAAPAPVDGPVAPLPRPPAGDAVTTGTVSGGLTGQIALSFWNNAAKRCTYEITILNVAGCLRGAEACQASRRIFSLNNTSEPALSPDGQTLAWRGWGGIPDELRPGEPHPFKGCAEPTAERWLQTATLEVAMVRSMTGYYEDAHPDWSPDGQRVLFDTGRNGDGITRIRFFYADGSGEEELQIAGQQPAWAPDNERFVYRGCDNTGNRCGLWLARATPLKPWEAGANIIGPILQEAEAAHPDWSPVTDEIVYQSPASGSWDLYLMNADGTGQRPLTAGQGVAGLPAWSPDGQWIAYVAFDGVNWSLHAVNRNGEQDQKIFAYDGGLYTLPVAVEPYGSRDWLDEQISWSR